MWIFYLLSQLMSFLVENHVDIVPFIRNETIISNYVVNKNVKNVGLIIITRFILSCTNYIMMFFKLISYPWEMNFLNSSFRIK
jgi:hypothetical protein